MTSHLFIVISSMFHRATHHTVATLFKTSDLIGNKYLSMLVPSLSQMWLLGYDVIAGESPSFGELVTLSAVQAIPMQKHTIMLILQAGGDLVLYSGPIQVMCIAHGHFLIAFQYELLILFTGFYC